LASALTLASLAPEAPLDVPPTPAPADPPAPAVAAPPVPEGSAPPPVVEPFVVAVAPVVVVLVPVAPVVAPPVPLEPLGSNNGPMSELPQAPTNAKRSQEKFLMRAPPIISG
jgi:hypothetical protein